jgi:phage shock protein PspC (stress-responsive transcriptional regulator)
MLAGICGGLAEYFHVDATLVRLIWIIISLFGGIGVIAYIAGLIIIPPDPEQAQAGSENVVIKDKSLFWGSVLVIVGGILLLRQVGLFPSFNLWQVPWQAVWGALLVGLGLLLVFKKVKVEEMIDVENKKLYRSQSQKMLGGVCGGLAEYFGQDVSLVRILWVIGTIMSYGFGLLVYVIMLIVFPEEPEKMNDKINVR